MDCRFDPLPLELDDEAKVAESGLLDRQAYLCWNGATIGPHTWDGYSRLFRVEVAHVKSLTETSTIEVEAPDTSTLLALKTTIALELRVPLANLVFISFESTGPKELDVDDVPLLTTFGNSANSASIFVEERKETLVGVPLLFASVADPA